MDILLALKSLLLGIVEGLTEFLPISSTGHLIVVGDLLRFNDEWGKAFEVIIQFGAILAVCWETRARLLETVLGLATQDKARRFALNMIVATIPAIVLALLLGKWIKAMLFNPVTVAAALVAGGLIILWVEARQSKGHGHSDLLQAASAGLARVDSINQLTLADAVKVGLAQCLALIPGTSRSGATIIGGMLFGLSRRVATEFSFYLAIPVIFGATVYELAKQKQLLLHGGGEFALALLIGFVAAFASALVCVRWLIHYVASHDFKGFAWYRIVFGLLILFTAWTGVIKWGGA
ncbi:MAG: undecaprenyl-diphosphate phosphatase [Candidatus Protistobacter heckmanni]|nr:undecaprenyl-diphosphate phosphatase [Candidatus Protistobacter heckmanni]